MASGPIRHSASVYGNLHKSCDMQEILSDAATAGQFTH
jgi:hypothetical protein